MKRVSLLNLNALLLISCFVPSLCVGQTNNDQPKSSIGIMGSAVYVIETVEKGKVADNAGLSTGSTIFEVKGNGFTSITQFKSHFAAEGPNELRLSHVRNGKRGNHKLMLQHISSYNDMGITGTLGLFVRKVSPDSPAHNAGLQPGDVILEIDGKPFTSLEDFSELLIMREPGTQLTIKVQRLGEIRVHRYNVALKTVAFSTIVR